MRKIGCLASDDPILRRRDFLRVGSLSLLGVSLSQFLRLQEALGGTPAAVGGKAQACILLWLEGGPSQIDMWDPKPNSSFRAHRHQRGWDSGFGAAAPNRQAHGQAGDYPFPPHPGEQSPPGHPLRGHRAFAQPGHALSQPGVDCGQGIGSKEQPAALRPASGHRQRHLSHRPFRSRLCRQPV